MYGVRTPLRLRPLCSSRVHLNAAHTAQKISAPRRCVHSLPDLPYDIDEGLGEFLSPAALRMIAVDYQQGLLTRLNEQVKGTEMEHQSVTQTIISAAAHRRHTLAFNYASQALNNSFFLHSLKPPQPPHKDHEKSLGRLADDIRLNFGSLAHLKSTLSAAAMGMVNSGWVWLVSDERGSLQVVATFGAGTLLVRSRRHMLQGGRRPVLGETPTSAHPPPAAGKPPPRGAQAAASPSSGLQMPVSGLFPATPSRALHASSQGSSSRRPNVFGDAHASEARILADYDKVGDILTPLLCVSVHEHAWVGTGYGIWGKEEYLKRFWTVVDWPAVEKAYSKAFRYR